MHYIVYSSRDNIKKLLSPRQIVVWQFLENISEATPAEIAKAAGVAGT